MLLHVLFIAFAAAQFGDTIQMTLYADGDIGCSNGGVCNEAIKLNECLVTQHSLVPQGYDDPMGAMNCTASDSTNTYVCDVYSDTACQNIMFNVNIGAADKNCDGEVWSSCDGTKTERMSLSKGIFAPLLAASKKAAPAVKIN